LLNEVIVYKTAAANLTGQGLAGTVDLRTVLPLSKDGRTITAGGYYQWTQYGQLTPSAKKEGNRYNVAYIDQFDGGKVGIAVGYAHTITPWEGKQFQAWGYPTDSSGNFALGGTKSYVRTSNLKRDGLMGVLEWKPNENIHSVIDVYTSSFEEKQLLRGMEIPLAFWSSAVLQPGYTVTNGLVTQATLTNVQPVVRNDTFKRNDSPFSIGWNLALGEKSAWPVTFDTGYSRVTRTDVNLETWTGLGFAQHATNPDTMTVNLIPGKIPVIHSNFNYADGSILKLTDPQGWDTWYGPISSIGAPGYLKYLQAKDELGQLKLSTEHKLNKVFKDIEIGVSYSDRYKRDGEGPSGFPVNANGQAIAPLPAQVGTTDMSFLGLGPIYAYDPLAALANGAFNFLSNNNFDYVAQRFEVEEKISQFYTQLNLDTKLGDLPFTGNVGFRVINTDQSSKGYSRNGSTNALNYVTDGTKYTNFAPDLNLNLRVADDSYLRFSVARQIARPRMYDMRASQAFGFDPTLVNSTDLTRSPWSGGGGNPKLRPWLSDSVDLSFEKYFKESQGYVAFAAFEKKLLTYIYNQSTLGDFSGYPTGALNPALHQGVVTQPLNGTGGNIRGLELTVSLASELFNKDVKGFGVVMGGAYTDSSVKPWGPTGGDAPIAGLSRKVANITLYYEHSGFSVRVSEHYRSANRQYITTFGPPNRGGDVSSGGGFSTAQAEKIVDGQISYAIQSGPAKGLSFYLQAYNLNDEPLVTFQNNDPRQVMNYQKYGASYSLGASYKF
jgi:iron complex outermembrane receptor protein